MNALQIAGLVVGGAGLLEVAVDRATWGPVGMLAGAVMFGVGTHLQRAEETVPSAEAIAGGPRPNPSICTVMNDHEYCLYQSVGDTELYYYQIDGGPMIFGGSWAQAMAVAESTIMDMPDWDA